MGLYGVLVVTEPDDVTGREPAHQAYGTRYDQDLAILLSEIDPLQNAAVDQAVRTRRLQRQARLERADRPMRRSRRAHLLSAGRQLHAAVPPDQRRVVRPHQRATRRRSAVAGPRLHQGNVLLRLVNAGLRLHVPSVVGAKMTLLAEDGNKLPGLPRVQSEVLLPAGKTYDVAIQPAVGPSSSPAPMRRRPTRCSIAHSACRPPTSATAACRRRSGLPAARRPVPALRLRRRC